jgi:hypothetical protein
MRWIWPYWWPTDPFAISRSVWPHGIWSSWHSNGGDGFCQRHCRTLRRSSLCVQ